ncbi:MAG: acetyl-CoA acetyltransferase [Candidatus Methanoperedens nitroreducens]|jgi:acetyl-CoA C-acetyltransferase|uniref:Acetyl-CoA acetyltransferase n=1 Tax=Candidatus Methanoperedens nitratireducens TaxID=1392998 RepID=A0A0P8CKG0_9EURY|nr:thiolase domain-containing protein [Candidatus Methanoperedens sp. BLZ2]KAB2946794.1 MAG: thiolase domain-containing protein [Candidatus Methanoperedens sp.]KPQ43548.1 MAG: acetyl-CoA acetyltransferase [Candidatus Methanoperedens sp. BLZ1]MBZ0175785.1 thiolase domain-containing protein [Candidatus Methanoperedens nitroreducens]MCX9079242.1 thiolase domain-containing protein [Candidatus Methanoperedens sp.]MCX9087864.1 thiolase domain-containing protein [Candidatus Methanoperedens sp.]
MRDVAIIGVGCTEFGELWDKSFRELFVEAGVSAIEDANVQGGKIDALYVGNMSGGRFIEQEHLGALIADYSGLASLNVPSTRVEAACASGGLALRQGILAVASGYHDIVVAGGAEKMTDVGVETTTDALAAAADREWEGIMGATFPGLYAMIAKLHMHKYGTTQEQLAAVAVKNHHNGTMNPKAQFQNEISIETVINSLMVADPLRVFDCSPITDGASAVVIAPAEIARKYSDTPIYVKASAQASGTISLHDRPDITTVDATVAAAKWAYKMAKLKPKDIGFAEVHDCFTIAEICAIEDLGFVKKGEGGPATESGMTALGGKIPINPSGGLKACGHPVGATGVKQAVEITLQLRGEAGKRQINGAEIGLTHNVGGSGGTAVVHIFGREK